MSTLGLLYKLPKYGRRLVVPTPVPIFRVLGPFCEKKIDFKGEILVLCLYVKTSMTMLNCNP